MAQGGTHAADSEGVAGRCASSVTVAAASRRWAGLPLLNAREDGHTIADEEYARALLRQQTVASELGSLIYYDGDTTLWAITLRADIRADLNKMRDDLRGDINPLRDDMRAEAQRRQTAPPMLSM